MKALVREFSVEAARVEEIGFSETLAPAEVALANAVLKAEAVMEKHPQDWVLAADTIVVLGNKVYGKPCDLAEAAQVLQEFSGKTHRVLTAVVLGCALENKRTEFTAESKVTFRNLSKQDIHNYLSQVPVLDKAGSYGIQEKGELLVESIEGELENIIGLPVKRLAEEMKKLGILDRF